MNVQSFTIPGMLPGLEDMVQMAKGPSGIRRYNEMKCRETERIGLEILRGKVRQCAQGAFLQFTWVEQNRKRDKDNISGGGKKLILDAMRAVGILRNDGWRDVTGFSDSFSVDHINPRIIVTITIEET